jgi:hypothetical protein
MRANYAAAGGAVRASTGLIVRILVSDSPEFRADTPWGSASASMTVPSPLPQSASRILGLEADPRPRSGVVDRDHA